jgi:hypothetical protein
MAGRQGSRDDRCDDDRCDDDRCDDDRCDGDEVMRVVKTVFE